MPSKNSFRYLSLQKEIAGLRLFQFLHYEGSECDWRAKRLLAYINICNLFISDNIMLYHESVWSLNYIM